MKRIITFLFFVLIGTAFCSAQGLKIVQGKVINVNNREGIEGVRIYAYNTVAEGRDALKSCKQQHEQNVTFDAGLATSALSEADGTYEILVAPTGALLFEYVTGKLTAQLCLVEGRLKVDAQFDVEVTETLREVVHIEDSGTGDTVEVGPPTADGDYVTATTSYPLPSKKLAKTTSRLVIQSFELNADRTDTTNFSDPLVFDGEQFHTTQLRRMAFDPDCDPLYPFADKKPPFTKDLSKIVWTDRVYLPDQSIIKFVVTQIWIEDYNKVVFRDSLQTINTRRLRRPTQFLEYNLATQEFDPERYKRRPKREKRDQEANISVNFVVGKAEIDPRDSVSFQSLNALKAALLDIVNGEGSTLKSFHIEGTSSPDGNYAKNVKLSNDRMKYIQNLIMSVVPKYARDRAYTTQTSRVASWNEVADILEADSLVYEAEAVRKIVKKSPGNMDAQWNSIRVLPFYKDVISPRLPRLRSVKCSYQQEIYRELTPEEILYRWENDEDYRSGKKEFELYEFGHLFNIVEDPEELEILYRRACVASLKNEKRLWEVPANKLAISLIKRNVCDTTILLPFIKKGERLNYSKTDMNNSSIRYDFNQSEVINNQVIMLLTGHHYYKAYELAKKMKLDLSSYEHQMLTAICYCLAGYFNDKNQDAAVKARMLELVSNSSPVNEVVVLLMLGKDKEANEAINSLDINQPVTKYLKAQVMCRMAESYNAFAATNRALLAKQFLSECFEQDPQYAIICDGDYDVFEELFIDVFYPWYGANRDNLVLTDEQRAKMDEIYDRITLEKEKKAQKKGKK